MTANALENRLVDIEVKLAFSEDLLDRLNDTIVRQQAQIDALVRETTRLNERLADAAKSSPRLLRDELPPHY